MNDTQPHPVSAVYTSAHPGIYAPLIVVSLTSDGLTSYLSCDLHKTTPPFQFSSQVTVVQEQLKTYLT